MSYQTGVLIGSGGMGEVFRAWDPVLQRPVALKYLKASSSELVERLKREARAQARIDHPAVCRVYQVGEEEGRPYIAMQYVDGVPLDQASPSLSLEQKVLVLLDVTEAVQAAHSVGLIHRDLKPANILIGEGEDGRPRPYVLDFGIAREQEVSGLTVTGQVIGTPGYLSPEQARGEAATLDRRTDIFSLGVILYELLSGRRPFGGDTQITMLLALLDCDPVPLRRLAPSLPRDLETVVMTCLAKEPDQRYPSARALADDLQRFLDGVPVQARRPGAARRLAARVRKHPRTTALTLLSLAAVVVLSGMALHARWSAARQARVAQRFGQEVERVVGNLERAYLLPLHDIRPDADRVRTRLAGIERELGGLAAPLQALGESAIGRGHLALGAPAIAREHLERAWQLGERSPQTAWALGQALAVLYRQAVDEANGIRTPQLREEALQRASKELREPALRLLERSVGAPAHPAYLAATLAYFSSDLDDALAQLAKLKASEPFFYPGDLLEGAIYRQRFEEASRTGESAVAGAAFAHAEAAFRHAAEVGESDPRPYEQLCGLWVVVLRNRFWGSGNDMQSARDAALEACGRALTADPVSPVAHLEAGRAYRYWAAAEADQGHEDVEALAAARRHARAAIDADPDNPAAYTLLGVTHRVSASVRSARGEDPEEEFLAAVDAFRKAIRHRPDDHGAHMSLANSQLYLGDHARSEGRDPRPFFEAAVDAARRAVQIAPSLVGGHVNLGIAYAQLAITARERGDDSEPLFTRGAAALERAIELNPSFLTAHYNLGELLLEQAVAELRRGIDPTPRIRRGLEVLAAVAEGYPTWAGARYLRAQGMALQAEWAVRTGGDPRPWLRRAASENSAGRAVNTDDAVGLTKACLAQLVEARWSLSRARDPSPPVSAGLAQLAEALAANPRLAGALVRRAELLAVRAEWRSGRGHSPLPDLDRAATALDEAERINPADAAAPATLARICRLRASWQMEHDADASETLARGLGAAARAIAIDPSRAVAWHERAALQRTAAATEDDDEARLRRLTAAEEAAAQARRLDPLLPVG